MLKRFGLFLTIFLNLQSLSWAATKEIHVTVKGMVCAFCAQGITKKFKAQPSVDKVDVSLEKKKVDVSLKPGKDLSDDAVNRILTESGYTVEKIERN